MTEALDRNLTVRIYYFSSTNDQNKIEVLNMQDDLTELFLKDNILEIDEFTKAEIEELELDVADKVLHCYFDIMLSEDYDRIDETPVMEDLQYNQI